MRGSCGSSFLSARGKPCETDRHSSAPVGNRAKRIVIPRRPWETVRNGSSFLGARGKPCETDRHSSAPVENHPKPIVIPRRPWRTTRNPSSFLGAIGEPPETHRHSSAPVENHPKPIVIPRRNWGTMRNGSSFRRRPESMLPSVIREHDWTPALAGVTDSNVGTTHNMRSMKKHD